MIGFSQNAKNISRRSRRFAQNEELMMPPASTSVLHGLTLTGSLRLSAESSRTRNLPMIGFSRNAKNISRRSRRFAQNEELMMPPASTFVLHGL